MGFSCKSSGANAFEPVISRSLTGRRLQQRTDYRPQEDPRGTFLIKSKSTSGGETPKGSAVSGVNVRRSSVRKATRGRRTARKDWQSQAHVKWDCKYHVVIRPEYRRKV